MARRQGKGRGGGSGRALGRVLSMTAFLPIDVLLTLVNMGTCEPSKHNDGGPGSIAEQSVDHHVNVLRGGGLARFQQTITGGPSTGMAASRSTHF